MQLPCNCHATRRPTKSAPAILGPYECLGFRVPPRYGRLARPQRGEGPCGCGIVASSVLQRRVRRPGR
eukprot:1581716-Lingulodinium_polyedra.AAC.1